MSRQELWEQIQKKASYLCVGLDTDVQKLPGSVKREKDPVFVFNQRIIDATASYCVAYKPNIAFYESMGPAGWESLQKTLEYIPSDIFTIADAKRGDIGNTASMYAHTFFERMSFDSVTVAPYMGSDSVKPFLDYTGKWAILLGLTSNPGSADFQMQNLADGRPLYEHVLRTAMGWGSSEQMMFVIGATHPQLFRHIRNIVPEHFFLVPGVGAQGGDLAEVSAAGLNSTGGLLVNASRAIIYASAGNDFAQSAAKEARSMTDNMKNYIEKYCR